MFLPRVKDMVSFEIPDHHVLVTASNDGFIKMWTLTQDKVSVNYSAGLTVVLLHCDIMVRHYFKLAECLFKIQKT